MAQDDSDWRAAAKAVPELAFLRRLVTGLSLVMGLGMVAIVVLLWLRLGAAPLPELPPNVALPAGAQPAAVTFARDWTVVVTEAGEVLLYDRAGRLHDSVAVPAAQD